jgi:ABC-type transporter MlaC component
MKKIRKAKQDASIEYEDESPRKQGGAEVEAITTSKNMGEVELRFILRAGESGKKEALFVAEDVVIDEVSLVNNYKEEFIKIITKSGFDGLLKKMEDQIKKVR